MTERSPEAIAERASQLAADYEKTCTGCAQSAVAGLLDAFEIDSEDVIHPKASSESLNSAMLALEQTIDVQPPRVELPEWIRRSCEPQTRKILFAAGAGLIMITFIFFGTVQGAAPKKDPSTS